MNSSACDHEHGGLGSCFEYSKTVVHCGDFVVHVGDMDTHVGNTNAHLGKVRFNVFELVVRLTCGDFARKRY